MSSVIRAVVSPLIKLWLRSQVESIDTLEIEVNGRDGQILKGLIPSAKVVATDVVYQDLRFSNLVLTASEINLNTPQILRREPVKLLQPIYVTLELNLTPSDLKHCLGSNLLKEALKEAVGESFFSSNLISDLGNDQVVLASLQLLLAKLGDEFALKKLTVNDGHCHCQGVFIVRAT